MELGARLLRVCDVRQHQRSGRANRGQQYTQPPRQASHGHLTAQAFAAGTNGPPYGCKTGCKRSVRHG